MRLRPVFYETGLSRSESGAVIYGGGVKKALLQSAPYLILLLPRLGRNLWLGRKDHAQLLWLVPAGFLGIYGMLAMDGSVALNMRYLNPALPFLAILLAREWCYMVPAGGLQGRILVFSALLFSLTTTLFVFARNQIALQERLFLDASLIIAFGLLVLQLVRIYGLPGLRTSRLPGLVLLAALIWSSAQVLASDFLMSTRLRLGYAAAASHLLAQVERNALLITASPEALWPALDRPDKILIATRGFGTCADIQTLIATFIDKRPVYWIGKISKAEKSNDPFCLPRKLSDGRSLSYQAPKRSDTRTEGLIHRIKAKN